MIRSARGARPQNPRYEVVRRLDRNGRLELFRTAAPRMPDSVSGRTDETPVLPGESPRPLDSPRNMMHPSDLVSLDRQASVDDVRHVLQSMPGVSPRIHDTSGRDRSRSMNSSAHLPRSRSLSGFEQNTASREEFDEALTMISGGVSSRHQPLSATDLRDTLRRYFPSSGISEYRNLLLPASLKRGSKQDKQGGGAGSGNYAMRAFTSTAADDIPRDALYRLAVELVPPDSSFEPAREAFRILDPFDTGALWPEMLAMWLERTTTLGRIDEDDIEVLTSLLDVDGDGIVSADDFSESFQVWQRQMRVDAEVAARRAAAESNTGAARMA